MKVEIDKITKERIEYSWMYSHRMGAESWSLVDTVKNYGYSEAVAIQILDSIKDWDWKKEDQVYKDSRLWQKTPLGKYQNYVYNDWFCKTLLEGNKIRPEREQKEKENAN